MAKMTANTTPGEQDGLKAMLRDIKMEVAYTRHEIGKDALDQRVMAAMAKVPRQRFVPQADLVRACVNGPVPIGHGQTISQPYIVALMTDLLEQLKPGGRLVIPIGLPGFVQELDVVEKLADGSCRTRNILMVQFVPLTRLRQ